jgi:putative spermidine/putrescine transport system permease protein
VALPAHATVIERVSQAGLRVVTGLVVAYLLLPILVIFPLSFTSGDLLVYPLPGWSLQWYRDFAGNPMWTAASRNSVVLAVATTVLATTLGTAAALGLDGLRSRLKPLLFGLLALPLIVPLVMVAVALFYYYAWLGLVGTFTGLVAAHTVLALPFVIVTVSATLRGFDPNWSRAAASLGAPPLQAFRRVTLPLILPGVVSGALFAFVTSFDELLVVLFVGFALLVSGVAFELGVSDAIGAFMAGLVLAGTASARRIQRLVLPLRDAFAALFFFAFGLSIDVGDFDEVIAPAFAAVVMSIVLALIAGVGVARINRLDREAAANIAFTVVARGEFALILVALAIEAGLDERLAPFVALYVLALAVISPLLASRSTELARLIPRRMCAPPETPVPAGVVETADEPVQPPW